MEKGLNGGPGGAASAGSPDPRCAHRPCGRLHEKGKGVDRRAGHRQCACPDRFEPRLVQALSLAKNKDYAGAAPLLDEVEKGLKAASAVAPPAAPPSPAAPVAPPPAPPAQTPVAPPPSDKAVFTERLKAIKPRYFAAVQGNPPNKPVLEKAMATAVQSAKVGSYNRGLKVLEGLDKALPRATADLSARLADSRSRWLDARDKIGQGLSKLQSKLQSHPDPRAQPIAEMGLNGVTGRMQVGLETALLECAHNPDARPRAPAAIAKYREFLTADPRVQLCDVNPWNIVVGLRDVLLPALNDLEKALAG